MGEKVNKSESFLYLSNGIKLKGTRIGAPGPAKGELVFTTGMVGYTQTLTDPSFFDQILIFTYPLMGNYGVPEASFTDADMLKSGFESKQVRTAAVIVSTHSEKAFHWRCSQTLDQWLKKQGIPGLSGIDTRHLAQIVRNSSHLTAILGNETPPSPSDFNPGASLVLPQVSTKKRQLIGKGTKRIALIDCGVKWNIVRHLLSLDCEIELLPWDTDLQKVDCSAWLISNGPGDPKETGNLVAQVQSLLHQDRPIFGICLGFQILALAAGASTRKLEFGHRGHNQPVQLLGSQRGFITSQNHGYIVEEESLPLNWKPWFRHLNDNTLEGIKHQTKPFSGVQFHPEASAGPQDTAWVLEDFIQKVAHDRS